MFQVKTRKIVFTVLLFSLSAIILSSYSNFDLNQKSIAFAQTDPSAQTPDPTADLGAGPIPENNSTDMGNGPIPEDNSTSSMPVDNSTSFTTPDISGPENQTDTALPGEINSTVDNTIPQVTSSPPATPPQPTSVFTPTQEDIQNINQAKASQTIAAEVNVGSNQSQTTTIDNNVSVQTTSSTPDSLNVNVSASSQTGPKVIAFNLNATTINVANLNDLGVMYDGKLIQPAPNMDAILHAKPTDNPSFAIVVTQSGVQILVLVPHFSTHSITITNMSKVIAPVVPEFGPIAGMIIIISVIGSLVISRRFS